VIQQIPLQLLTSIKDDGLFATPTKYEQWMMKEVNDYEKK